MNTLTPKAFSENSASLLLFVLMKPRQERAHQGFVKQDARLLVHGLPLVANPVL